MATDSGTTGAPDRLVAAVGLAIGLAIVAIALDLLLRTPKDPS